MFQEINETGCDEIVAIRVGYNTSASPTGGWLYTDVERVNQTQLSVDVLSYGVYEVIVTATNNENISSTSDVVLVSLTTSEC